MVLTLTLIQVLAVLPTLILFVVFDTRSLSPKCTGISNIFCWRCIYPQIMSLDVGISRARFATLCLVSVCIIVFVPGCRLEILGSLGTMANKIQGVSLPCAHRSYTHVDDSQY